MKDQLKQIKDIMMKLKKRNKFIKKLKHLIFKKDDLGYIYNTKEKL